MADQPAPRALRTLPSRGYLSACLSALHRRWKLAVIVFALVAIGAALASFPVPGLVIGLLLGIGLVLLVEYLDRTVKTVDHVRFKLGLPVLGTLPRIAIAGMNANLQERQLITGLSSEALVIKAYRVLLDNLLASLGNANHKVIMVTSCIPGEGKSTVSGNLAVILGLTGVKVLLIGCDLRRPSLGEMFGQTREPGLTELLMNRDRSAFRRLSDQPIDFIPGGSIASNPAELLDSQQMRDFLDEVRGCYDYVVIDAPPVLPITDAQLLAPLCDVRLMILEPCRTQFQMARQLLENLQAVGEQVDGVVLNDKSGLAARYYDRGVGCYGNTSWPAGERGAAYRAASQLPSPRKWVLRFAGFAVLAVVIGGYFWLSQDGVKTPIGNGLPTIADPQVIAAQRAVAPEEVRAVVRPEPGVPAAQTDEVIDKVPSRQAARPVAPPAHLPQETPITNPKPRSSEGSIAVITQETGPVTASASVMTEATRAPTGVATTKDVLQAGQDGGLQPALAALAKVWRRDWNYELKAGSRSLDDAFAALGLQVDQFDDDLAILLQLNTPLLIETSPEKAGTAWIAVVGRKGYKWLVIPQTRQGDLLSEADLKRFWTGRGYLPWPDPLQLAELDEGHASPDQTSRLQQLLVRAGCLQQFEPGVYDRATIKAIGQLQATNSLRVNGRLTPETLVLLYQADPDFKSPKFTLW